MTLVDFIPAQGLLRCAENHRGLCLLRAALSLKRAAVEIPIP